MPNPTFSHGRGRVVAVEARLKRVALGGWKQLAPESTFLSEILSGGDVPLTGLPIPAGQRAYFQQRLKMRMYSMVVGEFSRQCKIDPCLTPSSIATRLQRRPKQIKDWLSGPANWTLETVSDLLLALYGGELSMEARRLVVPAAPTSRPRPLTKAAASAALAVKAGGAG